MMYESNGPEGKSTDVGWGHAASRVCRPTHHHFLKQTSTCTQLQISEREHDNYARMHISTEKFVCVYGMTDKSTL